MVGHIQNESPFFNYPAQYFWRWGMALEFQNCKIFKIYYNKVYKLPLTLLYKNITVHVIWYLREEIMAPGLPWDLTDWQQRFVFHCLVRKKWKKKMK